MWFGSSPLCAINSAVPHSMQVELRLHDGLLAWSSVADGIVLLARLSHLINGSREQVVAELQEWWSHHSQIDAHPSLASYLRTSGLVQLFPTLTKVFVDANTSAIDPAHSITAYYGHLAHWNQVIELSLQLRNDLKLTNHKYIAHQLAVLYQCMHAVGDRLAPIRSEIESQFDNIKAVTHGADSAVLPASLQQWIEKMTGEVLGVAESLAWIDDHAVASVVTKLLRS